jgi:NOL1/NOP2/fmu family ribosome biogenesis protein
MLKFIYKNEKKELLKKLEYYGITELPFLLSISGKEKIRGYSGTLSTDEIITLNQEIGIELLGVYLFHVHDEGVRLSFDAVQLLKNQITKNIIDVSEKQAAEFIKGNDILLFKDEEKELKESNETKGFKVIKCNGDFLGTGKYIEGRIANYMPKERRTR